MNANEVRRIGSRRKIHFSGHTRNEKSPKKSKFWANPFFHSHKLGVMMNWEPKNHCTVIFDLICKKNLCFRHKTPRGFMVSRPSFYWLTNNRSRLDINLFSCQKMFALSFLNLEFCRTFWILSRSETICSKFWFSIVETQDFFSIYSREVKILKWA